MSIMRALIQRVSSASVLVDQKIVGAIDSGLLVYLGIDKDDAAEDIEPFVNRVINYRIFPDSEDKMNLGLSDVSGSLLIVSQFTLVANTKKGNRPSFSSAATSVHAFNLYNLFVVKASEKCKVQTGLFGADMEVNLCNDGPVTFLLEH